MTDFREKKQFGKKASNTIVISSNGKVREYKVHAGIFLAIGAIFTMAMVGYIGATTYLAFRDDLMAAAIKRNIEMQRSYEDRIAALRSKVDRITSRQLLDQQAVEEKVAALMRQQEMLTGQTGALQGIYERARKNGLGPKKADVDASGTQKAEAETDMIQTGSVKIAGNSIFNNANSFLRGSAVGKTSGEEIPIASLHAGNDLNSSAGLFNDVLTQIHQIATRQSETVVALQADAHEASGKLASVFSKLNVPLPAELTRDVGGPFVPSEDVDFADLTESLSQSLDTLELLKKKASKLPVGIPVPGANVSSSFGSRVDPFHRRSAFHAGIDFRASTGTPVLSSGSGTVIKAGRNGGYGLMVEIDHGYGITTRYAHLSRILVKPGHKVAKGDKVGKVGSTGRSTGPHLHYEVRRGSKASNPSRFLQAGRELNKIL